MKLKDRPTSRKLCVDEVFDRFREFAKDLLQDVPEARTLMLLVDWEVGGNEFPPAAMFGRNGQNLTLEELVGCLQQTGKLAAYQIEGFRRMINAASKATEAMPKSKNSREEEDDHESSDSEVAANA